MPSFLVSTSQEHRKARAEMDTSRKSLQNTPKSAANGGIGATHSAVYEVDMVSLWVGGAPERHAGNCGLHYDSMDNFHVLLQGQKQWTIYGPADAHQLNYIAPPRMVMPDGYIHAHRGSAINLQFENYGYNPRFSKARVCNTPARLWLWLCANEFSFYNTVPVCNRHLWLRRTDLHSSCHNDTEKTK